MQDDTTPSSAPLSRKQRKLRERAQRAKALKQQQQQQYDIAATAASPGDAAADTDAAAAVVITSDTKQQQSDQQQQQQQQDDVKPATSVASSTSTAAAADFATIELVSFDPLDSKLPPSTATYSSSSSSKSALSRFPSGISSSGSTAADGGGCGSNGSSGGHIHACVVLDPVYRDGEVVGYMAERTFLSPKGVKGGVKLVMKDVLGLLKAEGISSLNLGVAVAQDVKPGEFLVRV